MNLKMYKIYNFTNIEVEAEEVEKELKYNVAEFSQEDLDVREIRLRESMFLESFLKYKGLNYVKDMLLDDFILVELDKNNDIAMHQLATYITFNNKKYKYFLTTANWMKYEDAATNGKGKYLFINEDVYDFKDLYGSLLSLDKLKDYLNQEKCINKEIARLGLGLSSAKQTSLKPNYVILPEATYNIVSDIVTIIDDKVVEITESSPQDLLKHRNRKVTQFDGCGVMSLEFAKEIEQELGLNYPVSWVGIRQYGVATKGLVCSIDFNSYFQEFYEGDTEYFRKENDKFYVKDMFNNDKEWIDISDVDMILNESQVKWAKNFDSMKDIKNSMDLERFEDYRDMLENLWICKVNKKESDISDHNLTNYQLISNLNLTQKELAELQKPTEDMYRKVLDGDLDTISLMLQTFIKNKVKNSDDEVIETTLTPSTIIDSLIAINPELAKLGYVRKSVSRAIKKQIKLLCSGKFYVKSYYKTVIQDPISYLNWIMNRTTKDVFVSHDGLKANEFYCSGVKNDKIRNISRNPLNSFSEILNVKCVRRFELNKWYNHLSKDLFIVNCFDLTKEIMSGMDFDLDMINVIDNKTVIDSVVTDLPFINIFDGGQDTSEWKSENILKALVIPRGNLIGKLANLGSSVSNKATGNSYMAYKNIENEKIYKWEDLYKEFTKHMEKNTGRNIEILKDTNGNVIKGEDGKEIKLGSYADFKYRLATRFVEVEDSFEEDYYKKEATDGLFNNRLESYRLRNLQMKAIDSPKTMQVVEESEYEDLKNKYKKNAHFISYTKEWQKNKKYQWVVNALNINGSRISKDLLSRVKDAKSISDNKVLFKRYLLNDEENCEQYDTIESEVLRIAKSYIKEDQSIRATWKTVKKSITDDGERERGYKDYKNKLKKLDLKIAFMVKDFLDEYEEEYKDVADILCRKTTEKFALTFFTQLICKRLEETNAGIDRYEYIKNKDGELEFKMEKYTRKVIEKANIDLDEMLESRRFSNLAIDELVNVKPNIDLEQFKNTKEVKVATKEYKGQLDPIFIDENGEVVTKIIYLDSWKNKDIELLDLVNRKFNIEVTGEWNSGNLSVAIKG